MIAITPECWEDCSQLDATLLKVMGPIDLRVEGRIHWKASFKSIVMMGIMSCKSDMFIPMTFDTLKSACMWAISEKVTNFSFLVIKLTKNRNIFLPLRTLAIC